MERQPHEPQPEDHEEAEHDAQFLEPTPPPAELPNIRADIAPPCPSLGLRYLGARAVKSGPRTKLSCR